MEIKKKLLAKKSNQTTNFKTKFWVEINDDALVTYNKDSQIKLKASMLKSSVCYYSDAYLLFKGTISIESQAGDIPNNGDKEVAFKNCAPFTDCISKINKIQIDNGKDLGV